MFGFGKGKIKIEIPKYNYKFGETIQGTVKLELKKPTQAKELRIVFKGVQKNTQYNGPGVNVGAMRVGSGKKKTNYSTVHEFKLPLDGEKEYESREYPFQIDIPNINTAQTPQGGLGTAVQALQAVTGSYSNVKWTLESALDIPGGFDVSKKVQINVTKPQQTTQNI